MADIVDKKTRSRIMSQIKGKNTKPELIVRSELHKLGLRFRIHYKSLPGKPDIVLPKYKTVVFVHGCFWHHHNCKYFQWPKSNREFWERKINRNITRDIEVIEQLIQLDWRVLQIWECCIRGKSEQQISKTMKSAYKWIIKKRNTEVQGEFPVERHC